MRRWRGLRLAVALVCLGWLGLMAYVWIWTRADWGVGWALVGTINITVVAVLALLLVWLIAAVGRRIRPRR
jgi:hypothetical protein